MARRKPSLTITVRVTVDAVTPDVTLRWDPPLNGPDKKDDNNREAERDMLFNKGATVLAALQLGKLFANLQEAVAKHPDEEFAREMPLRMALFRQLMQDDDRSDQPVVPATKVFQDE